MGKTRPPGSFTVVKSTAGRGFVRQACQKISSRARTNRTAIRRSIARWEAMSIRKGEGGPVRPASLGQAAYWMVAACPTGRMKATLPAESTNWTLVVSA